MVCSKFVFCLVYASWLYVDTYNIPTRTKLNTCRITGNAQWTGCQSVIHFKSENHIYLASSETCLQNNLIIAVFIVPITHLFYFSTSLYTSEWSLKYVSLHIKSVWVLHKCVYLWSQNSLRSNKCAQKDSQIYFLSHEWTCGSHIYISYIYYISYINTKKSHMKWDFKI